MIYLDNASTSYVYDECIAHVEADLMKFGNPSNSYKLGDFGKEIIKNAKEKIAKCIGCKPNEIYFTSGASEGNAWAIKQRKRCYCSGYEHHNYLDNENVIECDLGWLKSCLEVEERFGQGMYSENAYAHMLVSNETGEIFNVKECFDIAKKLGMLCICDCTQAFGNMDVRVDDLGCDIAVFSGHKFHAPKGIGFVYIKEGIKIKPLIYGTQQGGARGGTENVAYIRSIGIAANNAYKELKEKIELGENLSRACLEELRDMGLKEGDDFIITLGDEKEKISSTLSLCFKDVESEVLQMMLNEKEIYIGTGSACTDGSMAKNRTLEILGIGDKYIRGHVRLSFSLSNNEEEVRKAMRELSRCYWELKGE